MSDAKKVCKWITDRVEEGRGAVIFCLEENDGMIGVWVGECDEHERALGYGADAFGAVSDAIRREAVEHGLQRTLLETCEYCDTPVKSPNFAYHFCVGRKAAKA